MTKRAKGGELTFWQGARDFLHVYCPKIRRMSPKTIEAYRIGMECFISYLTEELAMQRKDITYDCFERQTIKGYMMWMSEVKEYAAKTVELRLTTLKSFMKYSSFEDVALVALYDGLTAIRVPKQPKRPVEYMSQEATSATLAAHCGVSEKSRRNRMLLVLLYDSAARVSGITEITLGDLHLTKPAFVSLTGKGGKTRNMPLMGKTVEHLKAYLDEFHHGQKHAASPAPLFYSMIDGCPHKLSTDSVAGILKRAGELARAECPDVPAKLHCHLVRKTRAMDLYKEGVPLPLIMQMLGHESMSTTSAFYAFATFDMMAEAISAVCPDSVGEPAMWKEQSVLDALYSL
jgi:site-specific recombinase XerD